MKVVALATPDQIIPLTKRKIKKHENIRRKTVKKRKNIKIKEAKTFQLVMKNQKSRPAMKINGVPMTVTSIMENQKNSANVRTNGSAGA